ncbi:hypothetical protein RB601_009625 [Gaeumannomyces tritici]
MARTATIPPNQQAASGTSSQAVGTAVVQIPTSNQEKAQIAWQAAVSKARQQLGDTDYLEFLRTRSYDDCFRELTTEKNRFSKKWKLLKNILGPCLDILQTFDQAISTCCQSNPEVACLVWGGVQAVLTVASKFANCAQRIALMLADMAKCMPRFEEYARLFPTSDRLQLRLVDVYQIFVLFCVESFKFFRSKLAFLVVIVTWRSMDKRFENALAQLKEGKQELENEVRAANIQVAFVRESAAEKRHQDVIDAIPAAFNVARLIKPSELLHEDQNPHFVGRDEELTMIRSHVLHAAPPGTKRLKRVAIHGIGGMGKSQLALEYTFQLRSSFRAVFWIRSEVNTVLQQDFGQIARILGTDQVAGKDLEWSIQAAKDWLSGTDEPWLLVFDNVNDADAVLKYWPHSGNGIVIVTTRDREIAQLLAGGSLMLELNGLKETEAADILGKIDPRISKSPLASSVANEVGRMPLALCQMGSYLRQTGCDVDQFLQALKEHSEKLYSDVDSIKSLRYSDTLAKCCDLSIGLLKGQALHLLGVLAFFQTDNIQEVLIIQGCATVPRIQHLRDFMEWNDSIRTLARHSLVSHLIGPSGSMIRIHRVIKRRVLQFLDLKVPPLRAYAFEDAACLLNQAFPQRPPDGGTMSKKWTECALWIPHILSLRDEFVLLRKPGETIPDSYVEVLVNCAYYMWERGSAEASSVASHALDVCIEAGNFESSPLCADILTVVGALKMGARETRQEAPDFFKRALDVRKRYSETPMLPLSRDDHRQLANAYNNTGVGALIVEKYDEALELFKSSMGAKESLGTEKTLPYDFAISHYNIGRVYMEQGLTSEALAHVKRALELAEGHNGANDYRSNQFRFTYADLLVATGSLDEGLKAHEDTHKSREEFMGASSHDVAVSHYGLSCVYQKLGRLEDARRNIDLAIGIFSDFPGAEDRLARSYFRRSLILDDLQDSVGALNSITDAKETRARVDGQSRAGKNTMKDYDSLVCYYNR